MSPSRTRQPSQPATDTPLSAKGRRTRSRLIEAAKTVFERDGFLNARVSDIATEAGMAHGSFYHYFDSKEAVFREVTELQEAALVDQRAVPDDGDRGPRSAYDRIWQANLAYFEWYRREAGIMGVIEQVSRYDAEVSRVRMDRHRSFATRAEAAIVRLQAQATADPRIEADVAGLALGAMVARVAELWLVQGYADYTMDQVVNQCSLLWANALGVPVPDDAVTRSTGSERSAT